ncbi:unannotated protein [freshwater metagenome]|uniref:Unannotated protein n=1 Tax=freshwater metagenome TaxID=449393 RepID=A0A6J6AC71_9ZZZZ
MSWPTPGAWYSTRQVGKIATFPCRLAIRTLGRFLNQVVNRCRAYGGSMRTDDTPVVASIALRTSEPGLAPTILLASGAASVAALPNRSVWPMTVSVAFWRRLT